LICIAHCRNYTSNVLRRGSHSFTLLKTLLAYSSYDTVFSNMKQFHRDENANDAS